MGSRTTDTRTVLVLAGAWSSPAPEAAPSWRSVVGTIAVPAGRRGDFWLRFHDSPAPGDTAGVVVRGRAACQRLANPEITRLGEPSPRAAGAYRGPREKTGCPTSRRSARV